jgi:hypothetical protein
MTPERTARQSHAQLVEIDADGICAGGIDVTEIDLTDPTEEEPQILYLNASQPGSPTSPGATDTLDSDLEVDLRTGLDTGLDADLGANLDADLEALQEELDHRHVATHGEHLWMDERLVCSPASGRFWKNPEEATPERGEFLLAGEVIGHVVAPDGQPVAVQSPFSGWAMGFLIPNGSPVKPSEPVLWLRTL